MMLAVSPAAGGKPGVWILSKGEPRREQRKRKGSEQQDGKNATHQAMISVYGAEHAGPQRVPLFLRGC
jgi:hypothetical protein